MGSWYSNSSFCCVEVQIILINCQCLILAGWHRLKRSPQGMLGIYRPFYWERRAHNSKCVNGSASKLLFSLFFLVVEALRTLVEKGLAYICRGMKICQIAGMRTIICNVYYRAFSAVLNISNAPEENYLQESEGHKFSFGPLQCRADYSGYMKECWR